MADNEEVIIGYTDEGLTLLTYNQIVDKLTAAFQSCYGDDVDLSSNTPDGQLLRIFAEMLADEHDTMRELDNSFNPDVARGAAQDYRYRLNNIWRKAGLYTSVACTFTVSETTELAGLDGVTPDEAYAWGVTDGTYNYLLNNTEVFQPGTYTRQFTCNQMIAANPAEGAINAQISSVNNINISNITNTAPISIGAQIENDQRFAARREDSMVNSGMNCCDSITSQLLQLPTVVNAKAYEHDYVNYPDGIDADGIPKDTIWVVVSGGSNQEIGQAIYENISGTATKGEQQASVVSMSGQTLTFNFDYAIVHDIYLKFTLQKLYPSFNVRMDAFKQTIAENTSIDINGSIDSSLMNIIIREAISTNAETVILGAVPLNIQLSSDNVTWTEYLEGLGKQIKYVLLPENITVEVIE